MSWRNRGIAAAVSASVIISGASIPAHAADDGFIPPPVNPLPSVFNVSSDSQADVEVIPPPINPIPARDVFIQQNPETSSSSPTSTSKKKTPKKTKTTKGKPSSKGKGRGDSSGKGKSPERKKSSPGKKSSKKTSSSPIRRNASEKSGKQRTTTINSPKLSKTKRHTSAPDYHDGGGKPTIW